MNVSYVRQRVQQAIAEAKEAAIERRRSTVETEVAGKALLDNLAAPLCRTVVAALKADGFRFRVETPLGVVRVCSEISNDEFIEFALEMARIPPALVIRLSRRWGSRLLSNEKIVAERSAIGKLDEEVLLEFLLREIKPLLER